uniref:MinD/ParA family protein n=1 Tax=Lachnospira eligens TaxID=39485 RepID=UPI00402615B8
MDQAENLRNIIKKQNLKNITNSRVIAVTSGKGGVGKSSTSINLAVQFTRMGKKVIILDADFGLANIEVMFGVIPKYNLSDLMFAGKELDEIITEGPEGIRFISGGSGIAKLVNLDKEQVRRLVNKLSELEGMADVIIIDTGAGISPAVMEFLVASPETILVTTPEPTSITDSYALLKALSMNENFKKDETTIKMIANRVDSEAEGRSLYEKLNVVVMKFLEINMQYLGAVPQDNNIKKAIMKQKPVSMIFPNATSSRHFEVIATRLMSEGADVPVHKRGIRGYLRSVFAKNM